ncbi:HAD family hydrolase [Pseudorhodoferax sp. Leaf267]|uniref:HAD family hydrolase n=1 Tax=Pseudorhodoferax sp. Leaf267 TaxID=1736316 RepID=UPI000B0CFB55|nr:HAD-IA family hydrolase [Pseudorhodoferax sp. Leaf267]
MGTLNTDAVHAITLDLDDTLWPIWPTIARAEAVLADWLGQHAPLTAALYASAETRLALRAEVAQVRQDMAHDMSLMRREAIRLALTRAGEDGALAEPAFDVFFAERNRVELYEDALAALDHLAARFPLVALSNGNADLERVGLARYFRASVSASSFGVGKPDARIFQAGAAAAGVEAAQVLHVGDDALLDVLGAHAAGMQTAWVNRGEHPWTQQVQPHVTVASLRELCALL